MDYKCYIKEHEESDDATDMIGYHSMEQAAADYVEAWDTGDYTVAKGDEVIVVVSDEAGITRQFKVRAESQINYYADEVVTE